MKNVLSFASLKKDPRSEEHWGTFNIIIIVYYFYLSILLFKIPFQEKIESNRINSALFFYDDYLALFQLEL